MSNYEWLVAAQSMAMTIGAGFSFALRRSFKAGSFYEDVRRINQRCDTLTAAVDTLTGSIQSLPERWRQEVRSEVDRALKPFETEQARIWHAIDRMRES